MIEVIRIGLCTVCFYFAYSGYAANDASSTALWLVLASCGALSLVTALETYFSGGATNKLGWANSPYRFQSANNNLATGIVGLGGLIIGLNPQSLVPVAAVSILFFTINGINHAMSARDPSLSPRQKFVNLFQRFAVAIFLFAASIPLFVRLLMH